MHIKPNRSTPGPWHVDRDRGDVWGMVEVNGPSIKCQGFTVATDVTLEQGWQKVADAHLIAAAPIMYEALANLENDDAERMPDTAWKLVQDALKAARGEI